MASTAISARHCPAEIAFLSEEKAVHKLLGWDKDDTNQETACIFETLLMLNDMDVQRIAAYFMAFNLRATSEAVEMAARHLARADGQNLDDCYSDSVGVAP